MQGKLVRDGVSEAIRLEGRSPIIRRLKGEELLHALNQKLFEELEEYFSAKSDQLRCRELADLLAVMLEIVNQFGVSEREFFSMVNDKRLSLGGFDQGFLYLGDHET